MRILEFNNNGNMESLESTRNFVIVGANGSGKSHLGAEIENHNPENVLRISAQRALNVPDSVNVGNFWDSWNSILYGAPSDYRKGHKWGWHLNEHTIKMVNDYQYVLSAVFSKEYKELKDNSKQNKEKLLNEEIIKEVPDYITDKIKKVWDEVYPQRQIELDNAKVTAKFKGSEYLAKFMSDGERVALYLIAQCLLAPDGTYIVIDEPEIHLHKTIMNKLWDKIEEACPDNVFIYITHDLDFAASRKDATKIWVKDFDGERSWTYEVLNEDESIPDDLMMEVLGNRKPVLFVEGEKTSYDFMLYRQLYDDRYVIPAHNCTKVIEMTKAFNSEQVKSIHNLEVKGLIDRDYLSEKEISAYKDIGVETLDVAEVENLYLLEPIVRIVAERLGKDADVITNKVKEYVFAEFESMKDFLLKELCTRAIAFMLQHYAKPKGNGIQDLKEGLDNTVSAIDIDAIYNGYKQMIEKCIAEKDYPKVLSIFNRKSLHKAVAGFFDLTPGGYPKLVLSLLKTEKRDEIVKALKDFIPQI